MPVNTAYLQLMQKIAFT